MIRSIDVSDVINEIITTPNLKWQREVDFICIDSQTQNYQVTLCKDPSQEIISLIVYHQNMYTELDISINDFPEIYGELLEIHDNAEVIEIVPS